MIPRHLYTRPEIFRHFVEDELFPDGYCDCRCGPEHHQLWFDELPTVDAVICVCRYHRRECGRIEGAKIREALEVAKIRSTGRGFGP